jgi:glycosyltransferase involved in cell wall biosynthesis
MSKIKVSIIISVYKSYEIVRRQMLHFKKMNLPDDVEIIIVDDNSNPPISEATIRTENKLAWTQGIGRNEGAKIAQGDYFLFTDIDHILSKNAIEDVRKFDGDRMIFKRFFGILDENGNLSQDKEILRDYGLDVDNLGKRGLYASVHMNTFGIKRTTFELLGGYEPRHSLVGYHPISREGDDCYFNSKWNKYAAMKGISLSVGADIFMFPTGRWNKSGDTNPLGLFHNLSHDGKEKRYKD